MDSADATVPLPPVPALPPSFDVRRPTPDDLPALAGLVSRTREVTRGDAGVDEDFLRAVLVGVGSWTRRQVVVVDEAGEIVGWASLHDRAAGRADLTLHVDRRLDNPALVALPLMDWLEAAALRVSRERGADETRLEILVDAGDTDLQAWVAAHGHHHVRTWLNMKRPVDPAEQLPDPREGVVVRRVGVHDLGDGTTLPIAEDLRAVHLVLERSFEDHFNSYRESFPEFVQRLREDPGHRWDHWWLAFVDDEAGQWHPAGAAVCTVTQPEADGTHGTYLEYIGVHSLARGRGVAKALLFTVIGDAAERGRTRVGLEVDADSPTNADELYRSLGWETAYVTQSWHKDLVG